MYKEASQQKLRFATTKGSLSVEQLWDLSLTDLSTCVKNVKKILKKTDDSELSFLDDTQTVDKENELRFAILKDVYLTKKAENEARRTAAARKEHEQKILALIQRKKDQSLENMSIEDLEKMLEPSA